MDTIVITYLFYVASSIALTVWVGRTLHRNGLLFLVEVFHGDVGLATSMNQLLIMGFYLINVGYLLISVGDIEYALEFHWGAIGTLSRKLGFLLILLGFTHLFNMFLFSRIRRSAIGHSTPAQGEGEPHLSQG